VVQAGGGTVLLFVQQTLVGLPTHVTEDNPLLGEVDGLGDCGHFATLVIG